MDNVKVSTIADSWKCVLHGTDNPIDDFNGFELADCKDVLKKVEEETINVCT